MDRILQVVVIVFMLFLCILCLFAVVVILRDIMLESARNRRELKEMKRQEILAPATTCNECEKKVEEEPERESAVSEEVKENINPVEENKLDDNAVVFSSHVLTMEERYAALSTEYKRYFDDIVRHALSKEGVKENKHSSSYDYKDASYRVLRMMIKRSEIICEFSFIDREFKNYANASNVRMKQSATTVKVTEASAVGVVKDGIDLVCTQIAEDRAYKKQLAKEKRREKQKKNQEAVAQVADETVSV